MFNASKFGMHLAFHRRGLRLSTRQLGEKIGVSAATISRIELGNKPDIDTFVKICQWAEWEENCAYFFMSESEKDGNGAANS